MFFSICTNIIQFIFLFTWVIIPIFHRIIFIGKIVFSATAKKQKTHAHVSFVSTREITQESEMKLEPNLVA